MIMILPWSYEPKGGAQMRLIHGIFSKAFSFKQEIGIAMFRGHLSFQPESVEWKNNAIFMESDKHQDHHILNLARVNRMKTDT